MNEVHRVPLPKRQLPGTDIALTELGFGAASLGNLFTETSEADASAAVAEAWKRGIRYFDTAPHYGLGLSERRLGRALAEHPRSEYVISTKVGRLLGENPSPTARDPEGFAVPGDLRRRWDFSRDGVLRSVEASLERTGLDRFDILYLHDPDLSGIPGAAESGAAALIELREQGITTAVGIGSNSATAVAELFRRADIDVAMLAGRCTLLDHDRAADVLDAADGRGLIAVGVFNSGLLATNRPTKGAKFDYANASTDLIESANRLADALEAHGATLPQAAIAYPLLEPQVVNVTLGMRNAAQVDRNVTLYETAMHPAAWDAVFAA